MRFSSSFVRSFLVLSVLIALAAPCLATEKSRLERWRAEINDIDERQQAGKAKRAGRQAEQLWVEMRQRGWREPALEGLLAEVATQIAIAQLNLGEDQDRAVWIYHAALLLEKDIGERDWGPYGRAGRVLSEIESRVPGTSPPGQRVLKKPFPRRGRFERPAAGEPRDVEVPLNRAARKERMTRPTIEVVLRADGSVSHPAVVLGHSAKPTVLLAVLDMIWGMQPFLPGRLDGEPVDVIYEVSVEAFDFDRWDEMVVYH